ncbi:MAG: UMP kinase [Clostridiales Family XIII bacterium]|jgi:uridylate kinase|nr:UMP kinase [Clostridiales Family XIII bacterium]
MMSPKYKRVLLKLSGEALAGANKFGLNDETLARIAGEIKQIADLGVEVGIVVGGGNFWRGRTGGSMDRTTADYVGMLATTMNAIALRSAIENVGVQAEVQSAIEMTGIASPFTVRSAEALLSSGSVVLFAAGTGHPYFSTDTTAALRAAEIRAEIILFAKKVDAVYSDDPEKNPNAVRYTHLTHTDVLDQNLGVMDQTAAALCRDNGIAIQVFALDEPGNILKAVNGEPIGTIIV